MRFLQFLTEDAATRSTTEVAELIYNECQQYFKQSNFHIRQHKALLWRGLQAPVKHYAQIVPPANRRPRDTSRLYHDLINEYFIQHFGLPFRNGVFATTNQYTAATYGSPHIIFPTNSFELLVSPNISDYTDWVASLEQAVIENADDRVLDDDQLFKQAVAEMLEEELANGVQWYQSLDKALTTARGCEMMIMCESYFAIETMSAWSEEVISKLIKLSK